MRPRSSGLLHSVKMLWRNRKSYLMLSVTIVLSFTILLGYMAFTDSIQYNTYKEIFAAPREVIMGYTYALDKEPQIQALFSVAQGADPDVEYYRYYELMVRLPQYRVKDHTVSATVTVLPASDLPLFAMENLELGNSATQVFPTAGRERFDLKQGEAIVNRDFYTAIGGAGEFPLALQIPFQWSDGVSEIITVQIVGLIDDDALRTTAIGSQTASGIGGHAAIILTQDTLNGRGLQDVTSARQIFWFCTDDPDAVYTPLRNATTSASALSMPWHCVNAIQNTAREQIKLEATTKAVIAAFLFLLLGINLYSSFSNALADRKFEIGVKRALGASSWAIVRQFLTEGILVMLANTLLSVILVADILCLYRLYVHLTVGETWILHISGFSAAMFAVCSLTLTVVFSAIFGYKSTQVEIIQYLKAE